MARIFPSRFPHEADPRRRSEREFYNACRKCLSDDWTVVYSQNYVGPRPSIGQLNGPGEADFVLLHKAHGVLVVEVKGGNIDIRDGSWFSTDARGQEHKINNPFTQAEEAAHSIHSSLRRSLDDIRTGKTVRHCVAFPAVSNRHVGEISTYGHKEMIIFREDLDSLSKKIQEAVRFWKQSTRWSESDFAKVKQVLMPTLKTPGMSYFEYVDILSELDKLTESQKRTIRQLARSSGKSVIIGGAGTGKTVLGMYWAQKLASEGKKVVFVCANLNLAGHLRAELEAGNPQLASNITIEAASKFISETSHMGTHGDAYEQRKIRLPTQEDRVIDAVSNNGQAGLFDCLIVDEAQDVSRKNLELLELLVLPFSEGGSVLIFGDTNQQLLLKRAESALSALRHEDSLTLDVNCRNTYEIAKVAHTFTNQSVDTLETRSGVQIRTINCSGSLQAQVKAEVLAVTTKFDPHSLVVLTLNGLTDFPESDSFFFDGRRQDRVSSSGSRGATDPVPVFSARAFQGRESDAVVVAISEKSLLKTYPFKEFIRDVERDAQFANHPSTKSDLTRVREKYLRFNQHVTEKLTPQYCESVKLDGSDLSAKRIEFLVSEFEKSRLLEFAPEFRDPYLKRAWDDKQRRSLKIALYSMMTRPRVILSVISNPIAKKFIDGQIKLANSQVVDFFDEIES